MLSTTLAISVSKFVDPILLVAALICMYPVRRWYGILPVGVLLGFLYEGLRFVSGFGDPHLLPAAIAGTAQAGLAYGIYLMWRNGKLPERQPWRALAIGALLTLALVSVIAPGAILLTIRTQAVTQP